jgi:hypothetical protein
MGSLNNIVDKKVTNGQIPYSIRYTNKPKPRFTPKTVLTVNPAMKCPKIQGIENQAITSPSPTKIVYLANLKATVRGLPIPIEGLKLRYREIPTMERPDKILVNASEYITTTAIFLSNSAPKLAQARKS